LVRNIAVNARSVQEVVDGFPTEAYPFTPSITGVPTLFTEFGGTNDLGVQTAEYIYARRKQAWALARSNGCYVAAFEVPPVGNAQFPVQWEANRVAMEALVDGDPSLYDVRVRVPAELMEPANTAYYTDTVHFTPLGSQVLNAAFMAAVESALGW